MISNIDRRLQQVILHLLAENYGKDDQSFEQLSSLYAEAPEKFVANLLYLEEHGLVRSGLKRGMGEYRWSKEKTSITAQGIDFLLEDGGLSAILGVVTIKFSDETIRRLLEDKINSSHLIAPGDKPGFLARLQSLPADAIKHLTIRLLDKGMDSLTNLPQTIQTILDSSLPSASV
jgi:hypothetical protein